MSSKLCTVLCTGSPVCGRRQNTLRFTWVVILNFRLCFVRNCSYLLCYKRPKKQKNTKRVQKKKCNKVHCNENTVKWRVMIKNDVSCLGNFCHRNSWQRTKLKTQRVFFEWIDWIKTTWLTKTWEPGPITKVRITFGTNTVRPYSPKWHYFGQVISPRPF